MATTSNHSFLKHTQASGDAVVNVLDSLYTDLDTKLGVAGQDTFSGDGAATVFTIKHGLNYTPSNVQVTARSADAAGDFHVSNVNSTDIDVTFASAPASGTDNVVLDWAAWP